MSDLIEDFIAATEPLPSPLIFKRWAALGLTSALMSRRVWTSLGSGLLLYPNLFVFLVAPPAVGKSQAIDEVKRLITKIPETAKHVALAADRATPEGMIKKMGHYFTEMDDGADEGVWSYNAIVSEVGNLMYKPDIAFMQQTARLWDCPDKWDKYTVNKDGVAYLYKPYFTMLCGAQPTWISQLMSQDTVGLGLPSRIMFVYSEEKQEFVPFQPPPDPARLECVEARIPEVMKFAGYIPFSLDAQAMWIEWHKGGYCGADGTPYVGYGNLEHYADRRKLHVGKLALLYAGARHPSTPRILPEDLDSALKTVLEAEIQLPKVISAFGGNPYRMREEAILRKLKLEFVRRGRGITEAELRGWINQAISDAHEGMVLEGMVSRCAIIPTDKKDKAPNRIFKPGFSYE